MLEFGLAEGLGHQHLLAGVLVGGQQRRLRHDPVERPRDVNRTLKLLAVELEGGNRGPGEAGGTHHGLVHEGHQVDRLEVDALVIEHQLHADRGMGTGK